MFNAVASANVPVPVLVHVPLAGIPPIVTVPVKVISLPTHALSVAGPASTTGNGLTVNTAAARGLPQLPVTL